MTLQDWGICITAVISSLSLLISIFNYWTNKPKLRSILQMRSGIVSLVKYYTKEAIFKALLQVLK